MRNFLANLVKSPENVGISGFRILTKDLVLRMVDLDILFFCINLE